MRIALIWPGTPRLMDMTVRLDRYCLGLSELGHDVFAVCCRGAGDGFPYPVLSYENFDQLANPLFWRSLRADLAIVITWNRMSAYLEAAQSSGQRVIAIADTDGQLSSRLFLKARLRREWADDSADAMARTRLLWRYLKLYLFRWRQEDKEFVRSTELSHRVVFANEGARRNFVRCLILHGRGDLSERLAVVPYPVDVAFLDQSPDRRCPRAIAVGRWNDAQKNSGLLARSIEGYYRDGGDWEIQVVGGGGESAFLKLATQYPLFRILGKLPPSEIAKLLASSRVLLCTSRWESGPIVAFEALASGCTIVTTPLPSIISFLENGRGGRSSASHKPPDFLTSMREEFSAWDHGLRSTADLSSQWRSQLRFQRICAELVQGF